MRIATWTALTVASLLVLSACKPRDETVTSAADAPASASTEVSAAPSTGKAFDIDSVPTSDVTLGEFPYITLPAGYSSRSFSTETKDFARFPFWVKGGVALGGRQNVPGHIRRRIRQVDVGI